jgi:hypothetical protein
VSAQGQGVGGGVLVHSEAPPWTDWQSDFGMATRQKRIGYDTGAAAAPAWAHPWQQHCSTSSCPVNSSTGSHRHCSHTPLHPSTMSPVPGAIRSIHHAKTTLEVGSAVQLVGSSSPLPPSHRIIGSDSGTAHRASLTVASATAGAGGGSGGSGEEEAANGGSPKAVALPGSAGTSPTKALAGSRLRPPAEEQAAAGTAFAPASAAAFSGGEASDKDGDVVVLRPLRASTAAASMDGGPGGVGAVREPSSGSSLLAGAPSQPAGATSEGGGASTVSSSRRSSSQTTGGGAGQGGLEELRGLLLLQQQEMATLKAQLARLAAP